LGTEGGTDGIGRQFEGRGTRERKKGKEEKEKDATNLDRAGLAVN